MPLNEVLTTSGDIRRFIAQAMVEIKTKELSVPQGAAIAALAKEITASMQAEINVHKLRLGLQTHGKGMVNMGKVSIEDSGEPMGRLAIGSSEAPMLSGK